MATNVDLPSTAAPVQGRKRLALPWIIFGLVILALVFTAVGPDRLLGLFSARAVAHSPLTLTLVHTNDTWGYILPCG